jgi:hypothetical protein
MTALGLAGTISDGRELPPGQLRGLEPRGGWKRPALFSRLVKTRTKRPACSTLHFRDGRKEQWPAQLAYAIWLLGLEIHPATVAAGSPTCSADTAARKAAKAVGWAADSIASKGS